MAHVVDIDFYRDLMTEIRVRIHAVDLATLNQFPLPATMVNEFCHLQFRFMCELIALGCIAAHKNELGKKQRQFEGMWQADKIISELEGLNPQFYPIAIRKKRVGPGWHIEPSDPQPILKKDLIELYRKCGEILHKGGTKRLLTRKEPQQIHFPNITAIAQKFRDLLSDHTIAIGDGSTRIICTAYMLGDIENINVAIAEAAQPTPEVLAQMKNDQSHT